MKPDRISASTWLQAIRAPSLTATFAPCLATLLLGVLQGWDLRPLLAFFSVLGVLSVQIGVNLMNDVEDDARAIDRPGTLGGSGVIQDGSVPAAAMRRAAALAFGLGAALGLPAILVEPWLLVLVAIAAFGAWGYSSGVGLKYRALGDVAVLALCGPVLTVAFALAAFGRADGLVASLGLALGLAAVGILHVNNFQDMDNDRGRGVHTVALSLGVGGSRLYLVVVYVLALAIWPLSALIAGLHVAAALLPVVAALPLARLVSRLLMASRDPEHPETGLTRPELALVRIDAAKAHLALGALVSLGLGVALLAA